MSNDENSNESEVSTNKASETINETAESVNEAVESASDTAGNMVTKILALKESNPKVFYGGIGGLVLVIIIVMMMGGGSKPPLPITKITNISIGQTYELRGVNTFDSKATIQLLTVPGSIAAYDEDPNDSGNVCKYMQQGTKVKAVQFQQVFGNVKYVQVEMLSGECAGKKGWVIVHNLK